MSSRIIVYPSGDVDLWWADGATVPTTESGWTFIETVSGVFTTADAQLRIGTLNVANKATPTPIRFDFKSFQILAPNVLTF